MWNMLKQKLFNKRLNRQTDNNGSAQSVKTLPIKILAIADLHYVRQEEFSLVEIAAKDSDICVLLGDISPEDAKEIRACMPGIPILYVLGNHDKWHQYDDIQGLVDLDAATITINGITFAGISGAPRYKDSHELAMRTQQEVEEISENLSPADVLISHESSWNLLEKNAAHCGFHGISSYIDRNEPALHIFGHHHTRYKDFSHATKQICVFRCSIIDCENWTEKVVF